MAKPRRFVDPPLRRGTNRFSAVNNQRVQPADRFNRPPDPGRRWAHGSGRWEHQCPWAKAGNGRTQSSGVHVRFLIGLPEGGPLATSATGRLTPAGGPLRTVSCQPAAGIPASVNDLRPPTVNPRAGPRVHRGQCPSGIQEPFGGLPSTPNGPKVRSATGPGPGGPARRRGRTTNILVLSRSPAGKAPGPSQQRKPRQDSRRPAEPGSTRQGPAEAGPCRQSLERDAMSQA